MPPKYLRSSSRRSSGKSELNSLAAKERQVIKRHERMSKYVDDEPFTSTFVRNKTVGHFFRKARTLPKRIRLKSFVRNSKKVTFVSSVSVLGHLLQNLSIGPHSHHGTPTKSIKDAENNREKHLLQRKARKERSRTAKKKFEDYLPSNEIDLSSGDFVKGFIRINPKNSNDAYVSHEDTSNDDYYITSLTDRNRALEGDEVILQLKPKDEWINGKKTCKVVQIKTRIHPRLAVCKVTASNSEILFKPRDKRVPCIKISATDANLPSDLIKNIQNYQNILFLIKITDWTNSQHADGEIVEELGQIGDINVETVAILREFCLDVTPFPANSFQPESIPPDEYEKRSNLTKECIFTIDPVTARDLDDAVSVKRLPNGNYEIGVHISDPTYYLDQNPQLDALVRKKAVTVYLVQRAYHMLPENMCLHCSLLPGEDKLAFSVFWEMNERSDIVSYRFERTIVNSCAKLAYEHAQMFIDSPITQHDSIPEVLNGFTVTHLSETVNILHKLAVQLREKRILNGALKIDQIKLGFAFDSQGEPTDYFVYENKPSHRLIEEFMLLANITVAQQIEKTYPDIAFLRCHEPPKYTMLVELKESLELIGIHIDISSSGDLAASMSKYVTNDAAGQHRGVVLNHLLAKTMTRARYFCASTVKEDEIDGFRHYALSVPMYTHFTSPIRRYADMMVHRLLAASLNYCEKPNWDTDFVQSVAANCNAQKYNAKRAGEASSDLFLARFVEIKKQLSIRDVIMDAVVVDVKERSADVIVLNTGTVFRIHHNNLEDRAKWEVSEEKKNFGSRNEKKVLKVVIKFPKTKTLPQSELILSIFSVISVQLRRKDTGYKLEGTVLRPLNLTALQSDSV